MTKGKRSTRSNLRKRISAFTSSGKKKSKQRVPNTHCTCLPKYFDSNTGLCYCSYHHKDTTEPDHDPRRSPRQNSPTSSNPIIIELFNSTPSSNRRPGRTIQSLHKFPTSRPGRTTQSLRKFSNNCRGRTTHSPHTSFQYSSPPVQSSQRVHHESSDSSDSETE